MDLMSFVLGYLVGGIMIMTLHQMQTEITLRRRQRVRIRRERR